MNDEKLWLNKPWQVPNAVDCEGRVSLGLLGSVSLVYNECLQINHRLFGWEMLIVFPWHSCPSKSRHLR